MIPGEDYMYGRCSCIYLCCCENYYASWFEGKLLLCTLCALSMALWLKPHLPCWLNHVHVAFHFSGMIDITKIKEYKDVYSKLPVEQPGDAEALESRR